MLGKELCWFLFGMRSFEFILCYYIYKYKFKLIFIFIYVLYNDCDSLIRNVLQYNKSIYIYTNEMFITVKERIIQT